MYTKRVTMCAVYTKRVTMCAVSQQTPCSCSVLMLRTNMCRVCVWPQVTGHYREGVIDYKSAWVYLATINCITQSFALYCLVMFYLAFKKDLA